MKSIPQVPFCDNCPIKVSSIFKDLTQEQLDTVHLGKGCSLYKRGNIIYHEGHRISGFYCIQSGVIKVYKTGIDGKEQIIRFAKPGDIIGFRSVLSKELACTTAKVIEDSVLCFIPSENLFQLVRENPSFSMQLMQLTCRELGEANNFITDIAQKTVRERLAEVLLILMDTFGLDSAKVLQISLTREEMANMVGTATESVIRLLSEFKLDGLIDLHGRKISLIDLPGLRKIANM